MKIGAEIEWRKDGFGMPAQALYLGDLCVGTITQNSLVGSYKPGKWRTWFMSDDDGETVGHFDHAEEARKAVEKALFAAIKFQAAA